MRVRDYIVAGSGRWLIGEDAVDHGVVEIFTGQKLVLEYFEEGGIRVSDRDLSCRVLGGQCNVYEGVLTRILNDQIPGCGLA